MLLVAVVDYFFMFGRVFDLSLAVGRKFDCFQMFGRVFGRSLAVGNKFDCF